MDRGRPLFVRRISISLLVFNLGLWILAGLRLTTLECVWKGIVGPNAAERRMITHTILSEYQGVPMRLRVVTPDKMEPGRRYKVIYILPTGPQRWDFWWNNGIVEAIKYNIPNRYGVICVAPSVEKMPWFGDSPTNPRVRQESYIVRSVVPFVDAHYPTEADRDGRLLLGVSKAGCGAFTLLLRHPEVFGRAAAWDAPLLYCNIREDWRVGLVDIFGAEEYFRREYFLPTLLKGNAAYLRGQPPRLILMGYGLLRDHAVATHDLLQSLHIPHVYDNRVKRPHKWQSGWFPEAVQYLMQPAGNVIPDQPEARHESDK